MGGGDGGGGGCQAVVPLELCLLVFLGEDKWGVMVLEGCGWMEDEVGVLVSPDVVEAEEGERQVANLDLPNRQLS